MNKPGTFWETENLQLARNQSYCTDMKNKCEILEFQSNTFIVKINVNFKTIVYKI